MRKLVLVVLIMLPLYAYAQGCMEASSDEGVNVVGYLQAQYETMYQEEDDMSAYTINRARMGLVGNIPYDFSYYIMFEFSPNKNGAPYLLDGFITYTRLNWLKVTWGQFKSPFSLELNTPCQGLYTINRSLAVNRLANPDRDRGVMLSGSYQKLLKYALAFTNGRGRDNIEDNQNKAMSGRVVLSPVEMFKLGGSYRYGADPARDAAGNIIAGADDDERTRYAVDIEVKYDNILVQGEYIAGEDTGSSPIYGG